MKNYPIWSYLSISAMDAPLVSVSWYLYFTQNFANSSFNAKHCLILGVSVWLGYMADRLFDVRSKDEVRLTSLRHRFCKNNELKLWISWLIILIIIATYSFFALNSDKFFVGILLSLLILIYNFINQYLSEKRFPKEVFISAIFAYGTLFLIENPFKIDGFMHFFIICFINCLILTHKDKQVDIQMGVKSWTQPLKHKSISLINTLLGTYFIITYETMGNAFFAICMASLILHSLSKNFTEEKFRVVLDSTYALIPLSAVILDSYIN